MIDFKIGDFILYKDCVYEEYCVILDIHTDDLRLCAIEYINDYSKAHPMQSAYFFKDKNSEVCKLVTDEQIISRLKKIMIFK